jgi:large subunit ribosomal protein L20
MARAKYAVPSRKRRKKILKLTEGFWGTRSKLYRVAKTILMKSLLYSYRDRKAKKRMFRRLWITRIGIACRKYGISYSKFLNLLKKNNILLNRKILAYLAVNDEPVFESIVKKVKES